MSQFRHYQLCPSYVRGSHFLPFHLPGGHTGHKAASWQGEPTWNAHYSSTHHQYWYSFYLPTEGWRAESFPSQVELGVGIESGTCCMMAHCSTNLAISTGWWRKRSEDLVKNVIESKHIHYSKLLLYTKKEENTLLHPANRCMQDTHTYFLAQYVLVCKHVFTYKFIIIVMSTCICVTEI